MLLNSITYLFLGTLVCAIGAMPVGLVNLSVVDTSVKVNNRMSMKIAHGAAFTEILFAITALFSGVFLRDYFDENIFIKVIIIAVLMISGIVFWLKKGDVDNKKINLPSFGFLKGAFLNLISIQVFLFWLIAVSYLSVNDLIPSSNIQILLFVAGVWIGKLAVLRLYVLLGKKVVAHSRILSQNINRVIGVVLMVVTFVQLIQL
jgi:L-lysine exporter family protein LysE/ArgO